MPTNAQPPPLDLRPSTELLGLARSTRPDVARESLKIVVRRGDRAATPLARELLLQHGDVDVRATSAIVLGRDRSPESQAALLSALGDPNPTVLRRVAQSLGRTGDEAALRALNRVTVADPTPAGQAVRTARVLLSYRLGLAEHLVEPEKSGLASFRVARGSEMSWGTRLRRGRESVTADAVRELPGVAVDPSAVLAFECAGQAGAFVGNSAVTRGDAALEGPALGGVLLRERTCSERYSLDAYVLVDDRDHTGGRALHLWVMRPDGTLLHHGRATVAGGYVEVTISESNPPYSRPVRVKATLDRRTGKLEVGTAVVGRPPGGSAAARPPEIRAVRGKL